MRQTWVTPGGVHPPENKIQSLTQPIGSLPIPEKLVVPLGQHIGAPAIACVKQGDTVLKGQKIADPAGTVSAAIHAPTSGTDYCYRIATYCPLIWDGSTLCRNHH